MYGLHVQYPLRPYVHVHVHNVLYIMYSDEWIIQFSMQFLQPVRLFFVLTFRFAVVFLV
jgi:hypothetical protein